MFLMGFVKLFIYVYYWNKLLDELYKSEIFLKFDC